MPRVGLTPDKIVASAADLADRSGLPAVSLSALADKLGVRVPSLYKHIGGIDDLMTRLADHGVASLTEALASALDGKRGRDALVAVATEYLAFVRSRPGLYRAVGRTAPNGEDGLESLLVAVAKDYELSDDEALFAGRTIRSALHGFAVLEIEGAMPTKVDASFDALIATLDRGLAATPKSTGRGGFRLPGLIGR